MREDYPAASNAMAWFKAACLDASFRNGKEAVELSTKACELNHWKSPRYIDTLAAAYADCADFSQAIKYETQAINMKDTAQTLSQKDRKELERHLQLFKDHKPVRDDFKRNY